MRETNYNAIGGRSLYLLEMVTLSTKLDLAFIFHMCIELISGMGLFQHHVFQQMSLLFFFLLCEEYFRNDLAVVSHLDK